MFRYPDWVAEKARATATELVLALEAGREPFAATCRAWLDRYRDTRRTG